MNLKNMVLGAALVAGVSACAATGARVKPCILHEEFENGQIKTCTTYLSDLGKVS